MVKWQATLSTTEPYITLGFRMYDKEIETQKS